MNILIRLLSGMMLALMAGCDSTQKESQTSLNSNSGEHVAIDLLSNQIHNNKAAYIPAQCYTKTRNKRGQVHNPCFSCHTVGQEPNYIDDSAFQMAYDFRTYSRTNRWTNLFKDRSAVVKAISDEDILKYVRSSNYFDEEGNIRLASLGKQVPSDWDVNQNKRWDGYVPDCFFNFDSEGFDVTPQGHDSGWRAFAYSPFLGTFWPTNGSADDVLIRLPESMRQTEAGLYSRIVYRLNLAIVEAMITRKNIAIPATDESVYQVDLNRNGVLDMATEVVYRWAPTKGQNMSYVGKAKQLQKKGRIHLAAGLYPEGTEFLHTVRYLNVNSDQKIELAPRVKELRYSYKQSWNNYSQLNSAAMGEVIEGDQFPDRLRTITGNSETGVINGLGWVYQGFIEDQSGHLRPQTYEESMSCIGCHSGLSVTADSSFAFSRKLGSSNFQAGWFHWSQKGLSGLKEPQWKDGRWEYTQYLLENHSGNEFRNNEEVKNKFFDSKGILKPAEVETLHHDIAHLLEPSTERALTLNKAYKVIVEEQSYIYGREPHVLPLNDTVWDIIPDGETTGVEAPIIKPH
ncbi:hypothetical protein GHNINEIG_00926 [Hydrogenovibrio crunogenus]|uniref:Lipoprotein n=1 Tax=Hydrogenovibrio crunogenus TaxID=39765 RepID=A0A4P7NYQ9_9GAMM|nr:hypothetical protein [Hydrogenovibrio crunogenus]QBZ82887.1 hypothetical protein GHNINEIG_00926 [Hydrogenovibrio crunogenus]